MNESMLNDDSAFRYPVDVRFFEVDSLGSRLQHVVSRVV